jgi:peroxiredoxin Q/BCP
MVTNSRLKCLTHPLTYGEKKFMGRTYLGIKRTTFLIDEKDKIKKIFEKVKPEEHAREVLDAFKD